MDCRDAMSLFIEPNSVDSIVTDPPYGLGFMGKEWDHGVPGVEFWQRAYDVLKPGGHLLAFSGSRTYHRMVCAIEDAGFEIRDQIMWVYGSGFPKSLDVSKAIDKAAGAEREVIGFDAAAAKRTAAIGTNTFGDYKGQTGDVTAPATEAAQQWQGWGTALKPAFEPLVVAVKPLLTATEQDIINVNLLTLEARLWSLLLANAAQKSSTSNQNELNAACAIAQWTVADCTNTRAALCDQMDTLQFEWATNTSLSIVSSWRSILGGVSKLGSTSITETKSSTTTCWKTLSYCLSQITPGTIITGQLRQPDNNAPASNAERYFSAELKRLNATQERSAVELAISQDRQNSLDVDANVKHEPICVARKPLIGTVAANVLHWGTGGLNIDACRVASDTPVQSSAGKGAPFGDGAYPIGEGRQYQDGGRWPANLIHDGSPEVLSAFPETTPSKQGVRDPNGSMGYHGGAARFFYCAKASKKDRDEGLDDAPDRVLAMSNQAKAELARGNMHQGDSGMNTASVRKNHHPTVKPTDLMAYLCRLVTPPGGIILDPFSGSGSTGKAAVRDGFNFIGCELDADYVAIAEARIADELAKAAT